MREGAMKAIRTLVSAISISCMNSNVAFGMDARIGLVRNSPAADRSVRFDSTPKSNTNVGRNNARKLGPSCATKCAACDDSSTGQRSVRVSPRLKLSLATMLASASILQVEHACAGEYEDLLAKSGGISIESFAGLDKSEKAPRTKVAKVKEEEPAKASKKEVKPAPKTREQSASKTAPSVVASSKEDRAKAAKKQAEEAKAAKKQAEEAKAAKKQAEEAKAAKKQAEDATSARRKAEEAKAAKKRAEEEKAKAAEERERERKERVAAAQEKKKAKSTASPEVKALPTKKDMPKPTTKSPSTAKSTATTPKSLDSNKTTATTKVGTSKPVPAKEKAQSSKISPKAPAVSSKGKAESSKKAAAAKKKAKAGKAKGKKGAPGWFLVGGILTMLAGIISGQESADSGPQETPSAKSSKKP